MCKLPVWVKSGKFGHQVNSDTHLQIVLIQMRRHLMSRHIRSFTICLGNLFLFQYLKYETNKVAVRNLSVCPNIPDFTLYILPPWICQNGIGPTTVSNNFFTVREIGYSEKKYGDICQFMRDTCLFTSRNIVTPLPPSKQASTIQCTWVFCECNSSYSHSVVVDSQFNQCSSHLFILRLCYVYLCALSSFANILTRKMEMAALFSCRTDV